MIGDKSDDVPEVDEKAAIHADWLAEINRRMDALERGEPTIPWPEIRDDALARLAARSNTNTGGC